MIVPIAILILIGVTYLVFKFVVSPLRMKSYYTKLFKKHGYKVLEMPLVPLNAPYYNQWQAAFKQKGDSFYHHRHQYYKYDLIVSNSLNRAHVIIMNPQMIKEMLSPEKSSILPKYVSTFIPFSSIFQKGLIFLENNQWKHHRKVLSKVFNYDFIISQVPMMTVIAEKVFIQFEKISLEKNKSLEKGVIKGELYDLMVRYTSTVVMSGFLGLDSMKEQLKGRTIQEQILRLSELGIKMSMDPINAIFGLGIVNKGIRAIDKEYLTLKQDINNILQHYIDEERKIFKQKQGKQVERNIIQLLIAQNQNINNNSESPKISDEELIDQIKTFVIAGSETTSNFLTAMFLYMFEKPKIVDKLRNEINSIIKSDKDISLENLKKFEYLQNVILETSRMFSSSGGLFDRTLEHDATIFGVALKKDLNISACWIGSLYNPEIFENPFEFMPERWEKEECKQQRQLAALTFSSGPRGCIGKNLALTETKVMMIKFFQRYEKIHDAGIGNRKIQMLLTQHIDNSHVTITKRP